MEGNNEPFRDFEYEQDIASVKRIWQEIGWVDEEHEIAQMDAYFSCGRTRVATINGEAECSVHTAPGYMHVAGSQLDLCAVTAVTTSRIGRGQAFAKRLTAEQLLHAKSQGAQMAALGMFDQGFYDQLGFGTGAYDHKFSFDPGLLQLDHRIPPPERFSQDDAPVLHQAMLARRKAHGGVDLLPEAMFRASLGFEEASFGLGYRDAQGAVTHFVWMNPKGEHGPYSVYFIAYQTTDQLLELLGLLKSLSDQVYTIRMMEPPELQLQSLLQRPLRHQALTERSEHENTIESLAWWQARILDLPAVVSALDVLSNSVSFNLTLQDPLDDYAVAPNAGLSGDYRIDLGVKGSVASGHDDACMTLTASVNALTRMLLGVARPSQLALTDEFAAPAPLLEALDATVTLPRPVPGFEF